MTDLVAPFPYFGGKRHAADLAWQALGDVTNYVEPFFGSGAVLLGRPHAPRVETVNDADGLLANVWRAMRAAPDAVADHANWPVNEVDLHARHLWLLGQRDRITERLMADPDFFDAKAAGWWIWGACAWIGSGWCSGKGPWQAVDGVLVNVKASGDNGRGINRQLPHLGNNGRGINRKLLEWFGALAARMASVRVCCGDWQRVLGRSVTYHHPSVRSGEGACGVFLDPPYGDVGTTDLYAVDSTTVADEVRAWCLANAHHPRQRIVLAGYAGQGHEELERHGWRAVGWGEDLGRSGYNKRGGGRTQVTRETLWLSPQCLGADVGRQRSLFGEVEG